ncbi:MAG TPA: translation initiation factor IF-2 [Isosphaeraceae bacterium]|nr:translation initiation factor IF-2 [Isosphaeraceae bacterium]
MPPVAAPTAPAPTPRRPEGPRPAGPETKYQRPESKFTPAQMLAMKQGGQSPGAAATALGRAGAGRAGAGTATALRRPPGAPLAPPTGPIEDEEEKKKGASRLGTSADRAGRRARRSERAQERHVSSPVPVSAVINESDEDGRRSRGPRRSHKGGRVATAPAHKSRAEIEHPITLRTLSEAIGIKAKELLKKMAFGLGQQNVTINSNLDEEAAQMLSMEFGVELTVFHPRTAEDVMLEALQPEETEGELVPRPPIVTILGHVDHGKTSLLDRIRKSNVVATESGGITQHIGAYQIEREGKKITFVDTPGHEAFTAMRARGANVTDIVILVVAADDGVMPQTEEAIAHAKAADVPILVALNKIDLPNVNINKIYGELSQHDLVPVEYGGQTEVIKTSATTGTGIDDLLVTIGLLAELRELKANPTRPATGTCLEASISEGRGVVATVLVQDGTLRVGDVLICGDGFGRVRAMYDDKGRVVTEAGPSAPVEVSGLDEVPTAGEKFFVVDDISRAREIAETRRTRSRGVILGERQAVTLENLYSKMAEQKLKSLNLILKADVQGSLEALIKELEKLENTEVPIRILLKAVGGISESDVLLADASEAIVIGFRVAPEDRARSMAEDKKIDIRRYDIIYQVTDEIKKAVEGMLVPEVKEVHLGRATVRQTFKISKVGTVAGCFVTSGVIDRGSKARVIRDGREIYKGQVEALKRFKDDVKEVRENFECGIKVSNFDDLKIDDTIEAFRIDVIRRTL